MFFREERDKDFITACENVRLQNKHLSASAIAKKAIYTETQSFYLTTRELAKFIYKIRKGFDVKGFECSVALHCEIKKRMLIIEGHEKMSANEIARIIDMQDAPRFYISESRAVQLYYECFKKQKKENELRHRFDFYNRNFISN